MTDYTDLIARLRSGGLRDAAHAAREVADALEAQARRIAELEEENARLKQAMSKPWMGSARAAYLGEKE